VLAVAQLEQLKKMRKEQMWSKSLKRMLLPHYCRRLSTHKLNVNSTPRCQRATTFIAVFRCHDGGDMPPLNPLLPPIHPNYILGSMCGCSHCSRCFCQQAAVQQWKQQEQLASFDFIVPPSQCPTIPLSDCLVRMQWPWYLNL